VLIFTLLRQPSHNGWTLGRLMRGAEFECFICEDEVREGPKVYGKTAIPAGAYDIVITMSPRFKRRLPRLVGVPGFEGILIHPGNTAKDTEGCLLPGTAYNDQGVLNSRVAFDALFKKIDAEIKAGRRTGIGIW
jgi:hypothetical protein